MKRIYIYILLILVITATNLLGEKTKTEIKTPKTTVIEAESINPIQVPNKKSILNREGISSIQTTRALNNLL